MAELLIRAGDSFHPDPEKDRSGSYKKGDIVSVFEDGGIDGVKMGLPNFFIVKVPGVPAEQFRELREEQDDDDLGNPFFTGVGTTNQQPTTYRRRRYTLNIAGLSGVLRSKLANEGMITLNSTQLKGFVLRKRDNKTFRNIEISRSV